MRLTCSVHRCLSQKVLLLTHKTTVWCISTEFVSRDLIQFFRKSGGMGNRTTPEILGDFDYFQTGNAECNATQNEQRLLQIFRLMTHEQQLELLRAIAPE